MAKAAASFTCTACGASFGKWSGKCDACGAWNSIVEEAPLSAGPKALGAKGRAIPLTDLSTEEAPPPRASSGFCGILRNDRRLSPPPIADIDSYWTPQERMQVGRMLSCAVVGDPDQLREGLERIEGETQADELIMLADIFDVGARRRSLELTAQAWGLVPRNA